MRSQAVTVLDPADKRWADAEMDAIASDIGDYHEHIRNLFDNWTEGRCVSRFYEEQTVAQAFIARHPDVMSKQNINYIGQAHRARKMLGPEVTTMVVTDRALRAFGDPEQWEPDEARVTFEKAQAIAEKRIAKMEAKGKKASRGVITGDILEAMGRNRSMGTSSVGYWHNVLNNLTINHAGLTSTMAVRVAANAIWAAVELGDAIEPSELESLRKQFARLP